MPTNDIIDNRRQKLADNINCILASTEAARFAVGYLFLSGLESISEYLNSLKELRLLIGNTTNRETLEQLAEGRRRLELLEEALESQKYPRREEVKRKKEETTENIRGAIEVMDQTDEAVTLVELVVRMIEEKRLKVRVYTKGRMHAKAYIFNYGQVYDDRGNPIPRNEKGVAIVGSSNLSLSGVSHNTELNVMVHGNDNHAALLLWFEELWNEAEDFDEALMQEMKQSWALVPVRPYDIYMKTLYSLVRERLEGGDERTILWDDEIKSRLADFQLTAVEQAIQVIRKYGGVFISDVVGLGKSFIGTAIAKYFERTEKARPLVICPATLVEMWERYNEVYQLNARVLSMGYLKEDDEGNVNFLRDDVKYRDRDFVLIDESHNLRNPNTQRYKVVQEFLADGKTCCFLTATPRNKTAWDVYNQTKLFHQDDKTDLPVDPANLKEFFKMVEREEKKLPELLAHILIRRTRNHILRWYGYDSAMHKSVDPSNFTEYLDGKKRAYVIVGGKHQFFPKRELETVEYSIEDTYNGLYKRLRGYLGRHRKETTGKIPEKELKYARYGLWNYVLVPKRDLEPYSTLKRAGFNLRGLMRILLFKRFESSVHAFRQTLKNLIKVHENFLSALEDGIVPAGEDDQEILGSDFLSDAFLLAALRALPRKYNAEDFDIKRLADDIKHDLVLLNEMLALVEPITPKKDSKLQGILSLLKEKPLKDTKVLIFSEYEDTAKYLYGNLNPGDKWENIKVIYGNDPNKGRVVARFSPKSNPEYTNPGPEIRVLIATDVLSEGLNLQDCNQIVNYDLHWNPVRLIQRLGRIDRIGSEHDKVHAFNFLPETELDRHLNLRERLRMRIEEIHESIGEDSAILDPSEKINEEAMYAIYEKKGAKLALFEEDGEDLIDLNEAEEILRLLKRDDPSEYERIASMRDGIRTATTSDEKGMYIFCQAGKYQQLYLLNEGGEVVSKDIPKVLGTIRCTPDLPAVPLPADYNKKVMRVKRMFAEEVKQRKAERKHKLSLTQGQRYVVRELGILFKSTKDEGVREKINMIEKAFRGPVTVALNRSLNSIRRNSLIGNALLQELINLYQLHNMRGIQATSDGQIEEMELPRIVCSEGLI